MLSSFQAREIRRCLCACVYVDVCAAETIRQIRICLRREVPVMQKLSFFGLNERVTGVQEFTPV